VTDQVSLLDSDLAIIAGLREFNKKHNLVKCKDVITSRYISHADTLGNVAFVNLLFFIVVFISLLVWVFQQNFVTIFKSQGINHAVEFVSSDAIMSGYTQMMKKIGAMTKKG
jgi:hypothetical protein